MPTNLPAFIIGYHGCDRALAETVLAGQNVLKISQNRYDWLGRGIYFWENNPRRAYQWALEHKEKPTSNIKQPYAIGAVIDPGLCLDLTEAKSLSLVKGTYNLIKENYHKNGQRLKMNEDVPGNNDLLKRFLDCQVINGLHIVREKIAGKQPFDSVRSPFFEGDRLYETSGFYEKAHMQICVRKHSSILGYFRIIEEGVFDL